MSKLNNSQSTVHAGFHMTGFQTPDNVIYLADCLSSKETLDKYQITFIYDIAAYLNTLEQVKNMKAKHFIPAHAEATDHISPLAQYNIDKVLKTAEKITHLCEAPTPSNKSYSIYSQTTT